MTTKTCKVTLTDMDGKPWTEKDGLPVTTNISINDYLTLQRAAIRKYSHLSISTERMTELFFIDLLRESVSQAIKNKELELTENTE